MSKDTSGTACCRVHVRTRHLALSIGIGMSSLPKVRPELLAKDYSFQQVAQPFYVIRPVAVARPLLNGSSELRQPQDGFPEVSCRVACKRATRGWGVDLLADSGHALSPTRSTVALWHSL